MKLLRCLSLCSGIIIIEEVVFAFAIVMNEYIHIKRSFIETEVYVICESA